MLYRERKDLQAAFIDPFAGADWATFQSWLKTQGVVEYPALLDDDGDCKAVAVTGNGGLSHGCKWWIKRLLNAKTFLPTASYITRRLAQGLN